MQDGGDGDVGRIGSGLGSVAGCDVVGGWALVGRLYLQYGAG